MDVVTVGPEEPPVEMPGAARCLYLDSEARWGGAGRESPGGGPLGEWVTGEQPLRKEEGGEDSCLSLAAPPSLLCSFPGLPTAIAPNCFLRG